MNVDRDILVRDNVEKKRFETEIEGHIAFVDYIRNGDTIWFTHTEVPKALEGHGVGSALAKYVLDYAATNSLKVVSKCPFISEYIELASGVHRTCREGAERAEETLSSGRYWPRANTCFPLRKSAPQPRTARVPRTA